jgi:hypothetical protein
LIRFIFAQRGSSKYAGVDRDRLLGDQSAVVGGEEQREIRDVLRRNQVGQALRRACRLDLRFGLKPQWRWRSVSTVPGAIALTRMRCGPSARASVLMKPTIAALPDETTSELASVQFGAEPVAVFRFGSERFKLRTRLGPGNLEHAIASAAEVAASVFARWSHEALAFAQRVRAGEDGGPVRH